MVEAARPSATPRVPDRYGDDRDVLFFDDRPLALRRADLGRDANLHTIGGSAVRVEPLGPGNLDAMAYGPAQMGSWQSQGQRSYAWGTEVGYQLPDVWAKPWLRFGFNLGSGCAFRTNVNT